MTEEGKKRCPGCNRLVGKLQFHKNAARYDGLQSTCKDCRKKKTPSQGSINND